jgi:hypothetical protein
MIRRLLVQSESQELSELQRIGHSRPLSNFGDHDLQMLGPAHALIERVARIIASSDGGTSDAMSFIEQTRLRLAQLEGNSDAAAELAAIFITIRF